ncbi:MAG TPA: Ku protein, partial [Gemmatimonadales bacterium]
RGEKAYALLIRTLEKKGLTAIATITIRKKEQLCALRPKDGALMLETLYYPDEIRKRPEMDLDKVKITERELDMAFTLIDLLRKPFDPEEYADNYREALTQVIDAKLEGREVVEAPPSRESKVIDLADALRKSVEAAKKSKPKRAARPRTRPAARRAARKVS